MPPLGLLDEEGEGEALSRRSIVDVDAEDWKRWFAEFRGWKGVKGD